MAGVVCDCAGTVIDWTIRGLCYCAEPAIKGIIRGLCGEIMPLNEFITASVANVVKKIVGK
jgi:hypothetical protein